MFRVRVYRSPCFGGVPFEGVCLNRYLQKVPPRGSERAFKGFKV